jgi:RNA polymerase sigma factor (sigma-70 family)
MNHEATSTTLLEAVRNPENRTAWNRFDRIYRPTIVAWCRKQGATAHDAEEAAQNAMVKLISRIGQYDRTKGRFRAWLARVATNCWRDIVREQSRQLPRDWIELSDQFGQVILQQHDQEVLDQASEIVRSRVTERNWQAFNMVTFGEQAPEEVARLLAISKSAVYQASYRVREMLKEEVQRIEEHL